MLNTAKLETKLVRSDTSEQKLSDAAKRIHSLSESGQPPLSALNTLLDRSDLFDETAFAKVKLESEAVTYAKRQTNAASDTPQNRGWLERTWNWCFRNDIDRPLTGDEQRRFNRLLIEGAFPGEIRKLSVAAGGR